ncbi:hypothetical protein Halar_2525 [halophilic archaeon DL31]|nr:hypothetical protein Halar_2525 [halophilic archaeon DL31]
MQSSSPGFGYSFRTDLMWGIVPLCVELAEGG